MFDDTLDNDAGVAQYVKLTGSWLRAQGHRVDYIVGQSQLREWSGGRVLSAATNLHVRWAGNRLTVPLWPKRRLIRQWLSDNHYDIVHVQAPYSPFMSKYVINRLPSDTAVVATFHVFPAHWVAELGSRILRVVYGQSWRRIDKFLSVSPAAAVYAQRCFGVGSTISPNAIDLQRFDKKQEQSKSKKVVFLGRLVPRKGATELIKALPLVLKVPRLSQLEVIIGGDGPQRAELEALSKKLGIDKQVRFLGYVKESDKAKLLSSATVACFPSLYGESFGISLIEAMAAGSETVLGGDNPGYRSVLGRQPITLIDSRDSAAFAGRLIKLLTDEPLRRRLGDWQSQEVRQYDIDQVGPKLVDHYREAIAKHRSSR